MTREKQENRGDQSLRWDCKLNYGEERYITVGLLGEKVVVLVWTPRGRKRRIISMRDANDRERKKYSKHLD